MLISNSDSTSNNGTNSPLWWDNKKTYAKRGNCPETPTNILLFRINSNKQKYIFAFITEVVLIFSFNSTLRIYWLESNKDKISLSCLDVISPQSYKYERLFERKK